MFLFFANPNLSTDLFLLGYALVPMGFVKLLMSLQFMKIIG
jgi:hypothetical protein